MKTSHAAGNRHIVCQGDDDGHWSACFEDQPQMAEMK